MNNTIILVLAKEFSPTPGFRTKDEGPFPAVDFRDQLLYPKLKDAIEMGLLVMGPLSWRKPLAG